MEVQSWVVCTNEFLGRSTTDVEDFRPFREKKLEACSQVGKGGMCGVNFAKIFNTNFLCWQTPNPITYK